mmetsp:Transcript_64550/g.113996  ORF Transcript_64550/g.113996 Transcript_64550/m.113996 type:complete len:535 (+) Transcript_64550:1456-3060(+)
MHVAHLRPSDRRHLHGGVQLHGAGAQGDHRPVQRQILVLEGLHVAEHLSLGVVGVKHRVGQVGGLSLHILGHVLNSVHFVDGTGSIGHTEGSQQLDGVGVRDGLAEGQTHSVGVNMTHVGALGDGSGLDLSSGLASGGHVHTQGVEERTVILDLVAVLLEHLGSDHRHAVDSLCDLLQALGTVVHRVEGRHVGQQSLGRADVGSGLVTTNVLLSGLHSHAQGRLATGVHRHTDDASRHLAGVGSGGGEEASMRTSEAHRHTESLRRAHRNVKTHLSHRLEEHRGHQVRAAHHHRTVRVRLGGEIRPVLHTTVGVGVLNHHTAEVIAGKIQVLVYLAHLHLHAQGITTGADQGDVLRVAALVHEELGLLLVLQGIAHRHRLSSGSGLVQQRRVGQRQCGEVSHHGLVVQQRLQTALGDLRLVGSVRSVPSGVLQNVAEDHVRGEHFVVAHADERLQNLVLGHHVLQRGESFGLTHGLVKLKVLGQADGLGHGGIHKVSKTGKSDLLKHLLLVTSLGTHMAGLKLIQRSEDILCLR